jgi:2-dehydropantoate 2-reductase
MIKVLVIGAGAIGAFYGSLLAKVGAEVSVVCRSDYDKVKQHGFIIDSGPLGRWNFTPAQVLKNAAEFKERQTIFYSAPKSFRPWIGSP